MASFWSKTNSPKVYELKGKTPKKNCVSIFFPVPRSVIKRPSEKSIWVFSAALRSSRMVTCWLSQIRLTKGLSEAALDSGVSGVVPETARNGLRLRAGWRAPSGRSAGARAQLEEAQHEIRRLKYHRGRVKNALLEGVKLAEILAKFFGVAKK